MTSEIFRSSVPALRPQDNFSMGYLRATVESALRLETSKPSSGVEQSQANLLFPTNLVEQTVGVKPGEYSKLAGSDDPIIFEPDNFKLIDGLLEAMAGVKLVGWYSQEGAELPIIAFSYHKTDPATGDLEVPERVTVLRGIGYGERKDHPGQAPTWYFIGPQLGTRNAKTGEITAVPSDGESISAKNFSISCINGGPFGTTLANPDIEPES